MKGKPYARHQAYTKQDKEGVSSGMLTAYSILFAHLALIAAAGCIVLFFRGVVQYMFWIFAGVSALILFSAYRAYQRLRAERKGLRDLLALPEFQGKSVEISLLGGFASVRLNGGGRRLLPTGGNHGTALLEGPDGGGIRELSELAGLLDRQLISREEYDLAKADVMRRMAARQGESAPAAPGAPASSAIAFTEADPAAGEGVAAPGGSAVLTTVDGVEILEAVAPEARAVSAGETPGGEILDGEASGKAGGGDADDGASGTSRKRKRKGPPAPYRGAAAPEGTQP